MKKICISVAAFLAVVMTGCETYTDNLGADEVTETSTFAAETAPSNFEEITQSAVENSLPVVTSVPESVVSEETAIGSISLDYNAIATAPVVSETHVDSTETGVTTGYSEYSSEDGRPPLPDDLKDFYTSALEVYSKIYYCSFNSDTSTPVWVNGKNGYTRVTDTRFASYQSLYSFASYFFTDELMTKKILPYDQVGFVDKYGAFYMAPASNTKNPAYAGHVFKLVSQTSSEIVCVADVYYLLGNDAVNSEPIFYTEPADKSKYAVSQVTFKLSAFEDRWKFSEFSVIN